MTARRLSPPARSSLGQNTAMPALSSRPAPSRMRSARRSSSSGKKSGICWLRRAPIGSQAREPRRSAKSRSRSASTPKRASSAAGIANRSAASTTRLGSAVLEICSTPRDSGSSASPSWTRRAKLAPPSRPADASASQGRNSIAEVGSFAANSVEPLAVAAAEVLGRVSASASHAAATRNAGECTRNGAFAPASATAWPSGGIAFASCPKRMWSPGSSGPARQASTPDGLTAGCRRPRAIRPTPAVITLAHRRAVTVVTGESSRSASSARAVGIGRRVAGTRRRRTDLPTGRASSIVTWSPRPASWSSGSRSPSSPCAPWPPSSRKAAKRPDRGGSPGTNVKSNPASADSAPVSSSAEIIVHAPASQSR